MLALAQGAVISCQAWKQGSTERLEGMGEAESVDCYFLLGPFAV